MVVCFCVYHTITVSESGTVEEVIIMLAQDFPHTKVFTSLRVLFCLMGQTLLRTLAKGDWKKCLRSMAVHQ